MFMRRAGRGYRLAGIPEVRKDWMGIWIGLALLLVVTFVAIGLARAAASSVARFREEHHENFVSRK